jgi:hypothetical protein
VNKFLKTPTMTHFKVLNRFFDISKILLILAYFMDIIIDLILWVIMIVIGLEIWMIERALLISFFTWETQHSHGVKKNNL